MGSTHAAIDDALRASLPQSYSLRLYTGELSEEPWFEYFAADGSIASTAGDMTVYARLNLNRGVAPSGRLLSERAFALLTKPALNNYAYTGPKQFDTPPEYAAYAGPYANHNPEEGAVHVLVRKGQLFLATGMGSGQRLLPTGPATFRPEAPDFNPERISFDSSVEGRALRLCHSGMPMYRMDVR